MMIKLVHSKGCSQPLIEIRARQTPSRLLGRRGQPVAFLLAFLPLQKLFKQRNAICLS